MKPEKWKWIPFPLFGKPEKRKNGEMAIPILYFHFSPK
jgi:hypothetical protein